MTITKMRRMVGVHFETNVILIFNTILIFPTESWLRENQRRIGGAAVVTGLATGYYWWHLEEVPISGRRRFIQMTAAQETAMAQMGFEQILSQYGHQILPPRHPITRHVQQVAQRIIQAMDPGLVPQGTQWQVYVVDAPSIANALVLPGGQIFVFTGILPITATKDGLAAVLGHEIAHKIARHGAEKASFFQFISLVMLAVQAMLTGDTRVPFADAIKDLLVFLPFSRKMESEADYIGLLLMARACYDPRAAVGLWERMDRKSSSEASFQPPAFLSTHPSPSSRVSKIEAALPEALKVYQNAGCPQQLERFELM